MLRLAEELVLFSRREDYADADHVSVPLRYALAGSILMDLALENRIDTDPAQLIVTDATPLGDDLLDPTLAEIAASDGQNTGFWLEKTVHRASAIHSAALARLLENGVLDRREENFRRLFRTIPIDAYDSKPQREVRMRVLDVLLDDEIPEPRDVMLICLLDASGAFGQMMSRRELDDVVDRLGKLRNLELIGRAIYEGIGAGA